MKLFLGDTNLFLRSVDTASAQHSVALYAIELISSKAELTLAPQNLIEFWAVATRPKAANGLEWTIEQAAHRLTLLRTRFRILPEISEVFDHWFDLVTANQISGKRVHDARIAAVVIAHQIDVLVTFDIAHFQQLPIKVIHPAAVNQLLTASI